MHDEIDFAKIGRRIQKSRRAKRMTQNELAEKCGCSSNHISAIENGINRPSVELLIRLSYLLGESVDYFLMDDPHVHPKYMIDSQIAEKLDRCTVPTLQVVNSILDVLLEAQKAGTGQEE